MNTDTILLTGKPSVDRPWMKFYPEMISQLRIPQCTMLDYLKHSCPGMDVIAMHYYGTDITWKEMFDRIDLLAKSLKAIGFNTGDQIPVFFHSVPEFICLLLAAEKIGASLLCRDNTLSENVEAVQQSEAKVIFAHDFLSQEEMDAYVNDAQVEHVVLLSPYFSADKAKTPEHIQNYINAHYKEHSASGSKAVLWEDFLAMGREYTGEVDAPVDVNRPMFRAYTSGSTGPSKQVIHSSNSMIGVLHQMSFYGSNDQIRPTWLLTNLPPCLIAVVVSMILLPLTSNKLLILDPFCDVTDLDLEMMRYRPNCWPLIPMFIELVMASDRIPEDYDMSHLWSCGAGCEAFNNGQIRRAQKFLNDHNCKAVFSVGYGQSEAGSNCTLPCDTHEMGNGNIGIPMPLTTLSIFKPGTQEELTYNELGEICKTGPGNMLSYDDEKSTSNALQKHADGNVWLHTGDIGYINEDGVVFALTRGYCQRFGGGRLIDLAMENRVVDANIKGIVDEFFVVTEDSEHSGYFLPYLYVVLEDGYTVDDIKEEILAILEPYEYPVEITQLPERPFFHFKTNRIGLKQELKAASASN